MVPRTETCSNCDEQHSEDKLLHLACACRYCHECLEFIFGFALKNEECYPPDCCFGAISFRLARHHLSPALARNFAAKKLEMSTKKKTYCHNVSCNTFIAPHSIHNGDAHCQKCRFITCSKCKQKSHFGPCTDKTNEELEQLAKEQGWKKCPACERLVERDGGCNHML